MIRTLTSEQLLRQFIGFDRAQANASSFPPHNIEKLGQDHYVLTLAVAGFTREEIQIYAHKGTLTISGRKAQETAPTAYLHQGIAFRDWDRQFHLGEHIEVAGARTENGLLVIDLVHVLPDDLKPQLIEIK